VKSLKNIVVVLLALLLLGGGVLAWNQYQELVRLRIAVGSASDRADLQRRLTDAERRLRALQDQLAAARARAGAALADADAAGDDGAAPAPERGRRGGPGGGRFGQLQALMNNPQMQKLAAIQMKAALDNRYAALFKALNLPAAQLDQLKDLLVQKQQAQQDARQAAMQQGLNPRTDPQAYQEAITAAQGPVDDQIKAALGDSGFAQYQQYQQTLPERGTVSQIQQTLSYSSTPLTDDQANQLVQILAQTAPATTNTGGGRGGFGGGGPFGGGLGATTPITNQTITAAQTILSGSQLQALQQIQQQQQAQQQMQQLMQAARQNAGGGGGGGQRGGAGG
jgi:hypothetical protein